MHSSCDHALDPVSTIVMQSNRWHQATVDTQVRLLVRHLSKASFKFAWDSPCAFCVFFVSSTSVQFWIAICTDTQKTTALLQQASLLLFLQLEMRYHMSTSVLRQHELDITSVDTRSRILVDLLPLSLHLISRSVDFHFDVVHQA